MGKRIVTGVGILFILSFVSVFAQDPGFPDSLKIDSVKVNQGTKVALSVNFYNDEELQVVQLPLHYSSPQIFIDSVSFVGSRVNYVANKFVTIDTANQQLVIAVIVFTEAYMAPGNGLYCKIYFNIPPAIPDQKVVVDTMFFPPNSELLFGTPTYEVITPVFTPGKIIVGNPTLPPVIGVSPDSISFQGIAGGSSPAIQTLSITNLGEGTLHWKATKKSTWLNLSPSFGTAPSNVQVFANTSGLATGTYYDTITVSDSTATNNPVLVPVKLKLTPPPPAIKLTPTSFSFNAVAGSSNPPNQTLIVTNTGLSPLHWTASKSSSWLSLSPTSGTDSGDVTLSVDITGLAYGFYYDTIVVSDPNASNDPQIAPVRLEVASGLPLLAVDSSLIMVIIDTLHPYPPDRSFNIYNAGGGSMTFVASENSTRITSLTPSSGSVPQTVTASFKTLGGQPGDDFFDSVMVTSPEAINSPIYVVFHFHYVTIAARLALSTDSVTANYFECGQGTGPQPPLPQFSIFNFGSDPALFELTYSSTWLRPNKTSGRIPTIVTLDFDHKMMTPGTYRDTIVISAVNAINSPVKLPVILNILPTAQAPTIESYTDTVRFTAQEERPGKEFYIDVNNANPGCMSWTLNNSVSWVSFDIDSTNNRTYPWRIHFMPFAGGLTLGTYRDSCHIIAPAATNSPYTVKFKLEVWRFYGDCNWDGRINVLDLTYLIKFLYQSGPPPIPTELVGDCNCDHAINVLDLTAMIQYLYISHNPLCGNPY